VDGLAVDSSPALTMSWSMDIGYPRSLCPQSPPILLRAPECPVTSPSRHHERRLKIRQPRRVSSDSGGIPDAPIVLHSYDVVMCRNITTLRGLDPIATPEEIEAAARQYVRKVSGVQSLSVHTEAAFEAAVRKVADATTELLADLPPRKQPPPTLPPLRRIASRS
jgi:hypothetical protein